jgi:hypothetical protein
VPQCRPAEGHWFAVLVDAQLWIGPPDHPSVSLPGSPVPPFRQHINLYRHPADLDIEVFDVSPGQAVGLADTALQPPAQACLPRNASHASLTFD